jgi:predicted DNA-binding transcriptional regulator AlpA
MNTPSSPAPLIYDVESFCRAHRISRAHFYNLLKDRRGPRVMKIGRRTLITEEAAQRWREDMSATA